MTQSLVIDYASVDADHPVTPAIAAAAYALGVRVVGIRRSVTYFDHGHKAWVMLPDKTYARDAQTWRDAGMVVFAYDFPAFGVGAPSPEDQTANFIHAPGDIIRGVDIPPEFDLEFPGNGIIDTGHSQAEVLVLAEQHAAALKRAYNVQPGVYSSHVECHDTNGLGLKQHQATSLSAGDLWQKIPYPVHAGHPLVSSFGAPHKDSAGWDPADLWRIPGPWENVGPWIVQGQGDAIGILSNTVDVGYFVHMRKGESSGRVLKVQKQIGMTEGTPGVFDDVMLDYVKGWQANNDLDDDGDLGSKSYAKFAWNAV